MTYSFHYFLTRPANHPPNVLPRGFSFGPPRGTPTTAALTRVGHNEDGDRKKFLREIVCTRAPVVGVTTWKSLELTRIKKSSPAKFATRKPQDAAARTTMTADADAASRSLHNKMEGSNSSTMSCEDSSAATNHYQYYYNETATIRLNASPTGSRPWSLNSRVLLESTSTLRSSTPIFHQDGIGTWAIRDDATLNGTPFSAQVLELLSRYPLQRLLIRVGDAAASSGGIGDTAADIDEQQLRQDERARGPSGTSIEASFTHSPELHNNIYEVEELKQFYRNQYASLLRYLLDNTLFPPCGAPLDSLRVRKHGHTTLVRPFSSHKEGNSILDTVDVESFLPADGATFCNPGIQSFILSQREHAKAAGAGWGAAANNGACHSSSTWGLFDSLFPSSSGAVLSELLLGSSRDSTPWNFGRIENGNQRNSVWIDMKVSPGCFASFDNNYAGEEECSLSVTRGVSYRVAIPSHSHTTDDNDEHQTLTVSIGDLLLGHHTVQHSLSSQKDK